MSIKDKTVERGVLISKIAVIVFAMVCGRYFIEYMRLPKAGDCLGMCFHYYVLFVFRVEIRKTTDSIYDFFGYIKYCCHFRISYGITWFNVYGFND